MPLHNKVKEYRNRMKINQHELGKLVQVSRQTISLIERGDYHPSIVLAIKISKVFECRVEDIFSYEGENYEEN